MPSNVNKCWQLVPPIQQDQLRSLLKYSMPTATSGPSTGRPASSVAVQVFQTKRDAEVTRLRNQVQAAKEFLPGPIDFPTPAVLIHQVEDAYQSSMRNYVQPPMEEETVSGETKVCRANVIQLQEIQLKDLSLPKIHYGKYLILRTATRPTPGTYTTSFVLISPTGQVAIKAVVYDYPFQPISLGGRPSIADIEATFPIGSYVLIKEPQTVTNDFFLSSSNLPSTNDASKKEATLIVTSPSDVVILDHYDARVKGKTWLDWNGSDWKLKAQQKSLTEWKDLGNSYIKSKNYLAAAKAYTNGIDQHSSHPECYLLHLNRSQAFIKLERFTAAVKDATLVINHLVASQKSTPAGADSTHSPLSKACYRQGCALYALRRYSQAHRSFSAYCQLFSASADAASGLMRSTARLQESTSGFYDMAYIRKKSREYPESRFDCADFLGPVEVKVCKGVGGGRCVKAKRNIRMGELLMASKAFSIIYSTDIQDLPTTVTHDISSNALHPNGNGDNQYPTRRPAASFSSTAQHALRTEIVYRLLDQPELSNQVYDLYAGPNETCPMTYDFHAPGVHSSSPTNLTSASIDPSAGSSNYFISSPVPIDMDRIDKVVQLAYHNHHIKAASSPAPKEGVKGKAKKTNSGPDRTENGRSWLIPRSPMSFFTKSSLFNHSCIPNAVVSTFGDFQCIRAVTNIKAGDEIFINYGTGQLSSPGQRSQWLGFLCHCDLCLADAEDEITKREQKNELLRFKATWGSPSNDLKLSPIKRINTYVSTLKATYRPERTLIFRPELGLALHALAFEKKMEAMKHNDDEKNREVIRLEKEGLIYLGISIPTSGPQFEPETVRLRKRSREPLKLQAPTFLDPATLPIASMPRHHHHEVFIPIFSIAETLMYLNDRDAAEAWIQAALWIDDVLFGGGFDAFKDKWLKDLKILHLDKLL